MAKRIKMNIVVNFLRNVDEIAFIATGTRLRVIGHRILDAWGEDIKKAATGTGANKEETLADDPYRVLHCHPEDYDVVIKARFRLLCKELHPDTGTHPDPKEFQRVNEAYQKIMADRHKQ